MKKRTLLVTELLRAWYFIDSVLLNDHAKKCIIEDKDYEEYISLKAALLSDLYEFYNYIGYTPKDKKIPLNDKQIQENAVLTAKKSKKISSRMLERDDIKSYLRKKILQEFDRKPKQDIIQLSDCFINERFLKMTLDNILVGVPVIECSNTYKVSDFKGGILEQAYLTVRNEMVQIAKKYNPVLKKNLIIEGLAKLGFISVNGFMLPESEANIIETFSKRCEIRCQTAQNDTVKKICTLKCKIQVQQKIIMSIRRLATKAENAAAKKKFSNDLRRAQVRLLQYQKQLAKSLTAPAPKAAVVVAAG
jgi:hypothetical protein